MFGALRISVIYTAYLAYLYTVGETVGTEDGEFDQSEPCPEYKMKLAEKLGNATILTIKHMDNDISSDDDQLIMTHNSNISTATIRGDKPILTNYICKQFDTGYTIPDGLTGFQQIKGIYALEPKESEGIRGVNFMLLVDSGNHCVRLLKDIYKNGTCKVPPILGNCEKKRHGYLDGTGNNTRLWFPNRIIEGKYSNQFLISDSANNAIRLYRRGPETLQTFLKDDVSLQLPKDMAFNRAKSHLFILIHGGKIAIVNMQTLQISTIQNGADNDIRRGYSLTRIPLTDDFVFTTRDSDVHEDTASAHTLYLLQNIHENNQSITELKCTGIDIWCPKYNGLRSVHFRWWNGTYELVVGTEKGSNESVIEVIKVELKGGWISAGSEYVNCRYFKEISQTLGPEPSSVITTAVKPISQTLGPEPSSVMTTAVKPLMTSEYQRRIASQTTQRSHQISLSTDDPKFILIISLSITLTLIIVCLAVLYKTRSYVTKMASRLHSSSEQSIEDQAAPNQSPPPLPTISSPTHIAPHITPYAVKPILSPSALSAHNPANIRFLPSILPKPPNLKLKGSTSATARYGYMHMNNTPYSNTGRKRQDLPRRKKESTF